MQEIFNFLKNNWQLIVGVLTFIASVIVAAIRKKPINEICTHLYDWSILAIKAVEGNVLGSEAKLNAAISIVKNYFVSHYPGANFDFYVDSVQQMIEKILATPQKKER